MSSQTISFQTGPPRDGYGNPLPVNQRVPNMRPRTKITDEEIIHELKETITELIGFNCCFWACRGPQKMESMVTCRKCYEVRRLTMILRSLEHRIT